MGLFPPGTLAIAKNKTGKVQQCDADDDFVTYKIGFLEGGEDWFSRDNVAAAPTDPLQPVHRPGQTDEAIAGTVRDQQQDGQSTSDVLTLGQEPAGTGQPSASSHGQPLQVEASTTPYYPLVVGMKSITRVC